MAQLQVTPFTPKSHSPEDHWFSVKIGKEEKPFGELYVCDIPDAQYTLLKWQGSFKPEDMTAEAMKALFAKMTSETTPSAARFSIRNQLPRADDNIGLDKGHNNARIDRLLKSPKNLFSVRVDDGADSMVMTAFSIDFNKDKNPVKDGKIVGGCSMILPAQFPWKAEAIQWAVEHSQDAEKWKAALGNDAKQAAQVLTAATFEAAGVNANTPRRKVTQFEVEPIKSEHAGIQNYSLRLAGEELGVLVVAKDIASASFVWQGTTRTEDLTPEALKTLFRKIAPGARGTQFDVITAFHDEREAFEMSLGNKENDARFRKAVQSPDKIKFLRVDAGENAAFTLKAPHTSEAGAQIPGELTFQRPANLPFSGDLLSWMVEHSDGKKNLKAVLGNNTEEVAQELTAFIQAAAGVDAGAPGSPNFSARAANRQPRSIGG